MSSLTPAAWLVLAFGDERQYAGNAGYEDISERQYRYDTDVQNHKRVRHGDLLVILGKTSLEGIARIERIEAGPSTKTRLRCPTCRTSKIKPRQSRSPTYRCVAGHEFDTALLEDVDVTRFTALFGKSYVATPDAISVERLRAACPSWNGQLAVQRIDLEPLEAELRRLPGAARLLDGTAPARLSPGDALDDLEQKPGYTPGAEDTRALLQQQVRARRGQRAFRNALIQRYGARCMVTGCSVVDVLEAAHIQPYRGADDHHPENGLLLRADIHTLFDLDLLGIEPDTLAVRLHPAVADPMYTRVTAGHLVCSTFRPSKDAVAARWVEFLSRLESGD